MIIKSNMLFFSTKIKADKSSNGSSITPIEHGKGWILPIGFGRALANEGIEFEEIVITEEVETPK